MTSADDPTPSPAPDAAPAPEARRSPNLRLVALVFAVGAVAMGGLAVWLWTSGDDDGTAEAPARDITGVVRMIDEGYAVQPGPACTAQIGEGQIAGLPAFLVDGQGRQLAVGELGDGVKAAMFECSFEVRFPAVPDADAYQLTVEGLGSTEPQPRAAVEEQGWTITLSQGTLGT